MTTVNELIYNTAKEYLGQKEVAGPEHNPKIVQLFAEVGHGWVQDDETAWCAAFVGAVLERCGVASTKALNARSYLEWGQEVNTLGEVMQGDVVILWRDRPDSWKGHVGFYEKHDEKNIWLLGGNQNDSVSVMHYPLQRVLGVRRAPNGAREVVKTGEAEDSAVEMLNLLAETQDRINRAIELLKKETQL